MATKQKPPTEEIVDILQVSRGRLEAYIVGTSPLFCNRMSEKAKRDLLMPRGKKTATEKLVTLKHAPYDEYRASMYTLSDDTAPTRIAIRATAFKGAMSQAALDLPGARKAQIGRLVHVDGDYVAIFGVPQIHLGGVIQAGMSRVPDIRTRAIVPEWACRLEITFVQPIMQAQAVVNLLAAAGMIDGVGDWRPEKGKGNYGQFEIVDAHDERYRRIVETGGRDVQDAAISNPIAYDDETQELLAWYDAELSRRKSQGKSQVPTETAPAVTVERSH